MSAVHLQDRRNVLRCSFSPSARCVHCGDALLSVELSQRIATGIPTLHRPEAPTPQSSGARFSAVTAGWGIQLRPEGSQWSQEPGRSGATPTHLWTSAPCKCAQSLAGSRGLPVSRAYAQGEGAWRVVPSSSADLVAPGQARAGARVVPFLLLADLAQHSSEPRELEQRPYRPLFRLHLLLLLLLPPATRAVITGSDWPGCPEKEESEKGWETQGITSREEKEKEKVEPRGGAGSLPPCGRGH